MNNTNRVVKQHNGMGQFSEGGRIEATKNQQDAGKLFIGGIPHGSSKQALLEYLSTFGEIIDFIIKTDPHTGLSRGFGFVLFKDLSVVEMILRVKDHRLNGKKIEFKRAKVVIPHFPVNKIFVGGLNRRMTEERIKTYFGLFGPIQAIELPLCSLTQERRAFAFITYRDEISARKVLQSRFHYIGSSRCEVRRSLPKQYFVKQSKNKTKMRKSILSDDLQNSQGGGVSDDFQCFGNANAQNNNQDAHRSDANANVADNIEDSNSILANATISMPNSSASREETSAPMANPNAFGVDQHSLGVKSQVLEVSQYGMGPNQYTLRGNPNYVLTSQDALSRNPNVYGANQ